MGSIRPFEGGQEPPEMDQGLRNDNDVHRLQLSLLLLLLLLIISLAILLELGASICWLQKRGWPIVGAGG